MKNKIIILILAFLYGIGMEAQLPCYGPNINSACCNGIINTDKRGGFAVNQDPAGILNELDWTKKNWDIIHNPHSTGITYDNITNPFYRQGSSYDELRNKGFPLSVFTMPSFIDSLDFQARDGWQLLHAHFNYQPDFVNKVDIDNEREGPYLILYNKYTGRLRFIYNIKENNNLSTRCIVNFGFYEGVNNTQSFNYSALLANFYPTVQTLSDSSIKHTVSYFGPPTNGSTWSYGDFDLGYDPCVCNKENSDIYFYVENQQNSEIQMVGKTIGQIVSVDGSGNPPFTFGRDWFANVDANGTDITDGLAIYDNGVSLAEKYKIKDLNFFQQHILGNISTIVSTGGSLIGGPLSGLVYNYINDFTGIAGVSVDKDDIKKGITGMIATGGNYLNTSINSKERIPNIMFMQSFSKFSGTVKGRFNASSFDEVYLKNPGSLGSIGSNIYWKNKPFYNEPLGVFALLEKPKLKRKGGESKHFFTTLDAAAFWDEKYQTCKVPFTKKKVEFSFELAEPIKYVFNPSAEVDIEKTQISALIILPVKKKPLCEGICDEPAFWSCKNPFEQNIEIIGPFCLATDFYALLKDINSSFTIIDSALYRQIYASPLVPISQFNNLRFNLTLDQNGCTVIGDEPDSIKIRLMMRIVHKPNEYGVVKEEAKVLTYDVDIINSADFVKPIIRVPSKGKLILSNITFTKDTIIYAEEIEILGNLNVSNNAKVKIISTKGINQTGGIIDPTIDWFQGELYPSLPLTPQSDDQVKSFCASGKYQANKHQLKSAKGNGKQVPKSDFLTTLTLHPNPSTSLTTLTIENPSAEQASVRVYDLVGREIYTEDMRDVSESNNKLEISTDGWQTGIYIVKVIHGELEKSIKLEVR